MGELATELRTRRAELMLSQQEAAEQLGVSRRIYQAWEAGQVIAPHPYMLRKIRAWLTDGVAA